MELRGTSSGLNFTFSFFFNSLGGFLVSGFSLSGSLRLLFLGFALGISLLLLGNGFSSLGLFLLGLSSSTSGHTLSLLSLNLFLLLFSFLLGILGSGNLLVTFSSPM